MRGNKDDNHTDMGRIVTTADQHSYCPHSVRVITADTQMLLIQIQPHSPQNTYLYITNVEKNKMFILSKKLIDKFRPHQMTGTSQRVSQPSGERARVQINNFPLFFPFFCLGWSHSVCNTVYYKNHVFFYNQDAVF